MPLDIHVKHAGKAGVFWHIDASSPNAFANFLGSNDAKRWTFVAGPAAARKAFETAQRGPSKALRGRATVARDSGLRNHGAPRHVARALDWYQVLFEKEHSNSRIWAMVKLGDLPDPGAMRPAGVQARYGNPTLIEMQRRGFI